jgi:hypothetical protein
MLAAAVAGMLVPEPADPPANELPVLICPLPLPEPPTMEPFTIIVPIRVSL